MAEESKTASNLKYIANNVSSGLRTHRERLAARLARRLFDAEPTVTFTFGELIDALADCVDGSANTFATSAVAVLTEVKEDRAASAAEGVAVKNLREEMISQRSLIDGTYGMGAAAGFGYAGDTPEVSTNLIEASRTIEHKLRNQDFPELREGRSPVDGDEQADLLAALRVELEQAVQENLTEKRETQAARSDRNNNRSNWDLDYPGVANTSVGFFQLAGETDLADKVRPTANRRQGRPEEEDLNQGDDVVDAEEPVEA